MAPRVWHTQSGLDDGLLPYTRFNGSTLPASRSGELIAGAPLLSDLMYATKAIEFVRANAPESGRRRAGEFPDYVPDHGQPDGRIYRAMGTRACCRC